MSDRIEIQANAYAYGQSHARNEVGLKARRPNYAWVHEPAFVERAVQENLLLLSELSDLYDRMLTEGTHVRRYKIGGAS